MGLTQIFASILTALLVGLLTRGAWRTYFLLAASVFAIYWFQPVIPLRSFDFWLPSLTLALTLLTWFVTSPSGTWKSRQNLIGLSIILGLVTFIELSRYIFPDPVFTQTIPPQFIQLLIFSYCRYSFCFLFLSFVTLCNMDCFIRHRFIDRTPRHSQNA